jgi:hypothetical protein
MPRDAGCYAGTMSDLESPIVLGRVRTVYRGLTAMMVATASMILQLGLHLRIELGHWPRSCIDNPEGFAISLTAHATMWLLLITVTTAPVWLALTPLLAVGDPAPKQRRALLICVLAWVGAVWLSVADPTRGFEWLMD